MKRKYIVLLCIFFSLLITACSSKKGETMKQTNIYVFTEDVEKEAYERITQYGIDYVYPPLNDHWQKEVYDDDCIKYTTADMDSTIYILRNIEVTEQDDDSFRKDLQGRDIPAYLEAQMDTYMKTNLESTTAEMRYVGNLKFYNDKGTCSIDGKNYYYMASFFQTRLYQPSVRVHKTPTVLLVVYKNEEDTKNIENMITIFQKSLIYEP